MISDKCVFCGAATVAVVYRSSDREPTSVCGPCGRYALEVKSYWATHEHKVALGWIPRSVAEAAREARRMVC